MKHNLLCVGDGFDDGSPLVAEDVFQFQNRLGSASGRPKRQGLQRFSLFVKNTVGRVIGLGIVLGFERYGVGSRTRLRKTRSATGGRLRSGPRIASMAWLLRRFRHVAPSQVERNCAAERDSRWYFGRVETPGKGPSGSLGAAQ